MKVLIPIIFLGFTLVASSNTEQQLPDNVKLRCGIFHQIQEALDTQEKNAASTFMVAIAAGPKKTDILCAPTGQCCCPEIRCYNANGTGCTVGNECACPCGGDPCW